MAKFRIVSRSDNKLNNTVFSIEQKQFFGWKVIDVEEGRSYKTLLRFNSFDEAKIHILEKYCKQTGIIYQPYPN